MTNTKQKETSRKSEKEKNLESIPPDGGWGWMIMFGSILNALIFIPIIQNFALIYKSRLADIGLTSTDVTTIISINSSFGQICGAFQGPLLKRFGYRKLAFFASLTMTFGVTLTAFAQTFTQFIVTYGLITSIGFTYTATSFSLAMNSYFKKRRSFAYGIMMGCSGVGPIVMPQLITFLLYMYGITGAGLITSALNLHGLVGATLLQPVSWHMKKVPKETPENKKGEEEEEKEEEVEVPVQIETDSIFGSTLSVNISISKSVTGESFPKRRYRISQSSRYTGSSLDTLNEEELKEQTLALMSRDGVAIIPQEDPSVGTVPFRLDHIKNSNEEVTNEGDNAQTAKTFFHRIGQRVYKLYDLDLLTNPKMLNIILGISIAMIGELMFSLLTPYILAEKNLSLEQTAIFMSIAAGTDIIARFLAPHVGSFLKLQTRMMYIIALFTLVVTRSSILFTHSYHSLLVVSVFVGIAKGFRAVFWVQIIPDNVPYSKLPSAMSIQNLLNGLFILISGPLIGWVITLNGSYLTVIYTSNSLTITTILLWGIEFLVVYVRNKK